MILLTAPMLAFSVSLFARPLADSVGVENQNGKKVILHKLDPKDNYYSIGRRYNVKPALIMQYNNNVKLSIGAVIKVPTDLPFDQPAAAPAHQPQQMAQQPVHQPQQVVQQPVQQQAQQPNTTQYKVSQGETLYSIAKRFGTTVEDIQATNNLPSATIAPGEILIIKMGGGTVQVQHPAPQTTQQQTPQQQIATTTPPAQQPQQQVQNPPQTPPATRDSNRPTATVDSSTLGDRNINGKKFGLYEKDEKGVATWIDDSGLDPNKKLVLHRTAPIGTVIRITNPMTNRTTFAKVVGRFADSESTRDVIIVMTKGTADALGALDKRFHVNISYGTPNE